LELHGLLDLRSSLSSSHSSEPSNPKMARIAISGDIATAAEAQAPARAGHTFGGAPDRAALKSNLVNSVGGLPCLSFATPRPACSIGRSPSHDKGRYTENHNSAAAAGPP
jgi:hypothetical protein